MAKSYFRVIVITSLAFMVFDGMWMSLVATTFYYAQVGFLMSSTPNWVAVSLFYLVIVAGLLVFVIIPGLAATSLLQSLARAALFGLVTYGTYELTNLAVIKGWSVGVTVVDTLWGVSLCVAVSFISLRFANRQR